MLVLAPHPDDEALGMGAVLAGLAAAGARPLAGFLTDGSGSHVDAPGWSPRRIAGLRRQEARAALVRLGVGDAPLHLDWTDASPWQAGNPAFGRSVARLASWCQARQVRQIAVTWEGEPHCDHAAAAMLAIAVARRLKLRLYRYLVWGWTDPALDARLRGVRIEAVPAGRGRVDARRAMACHRSQRGGRIRGGTSFRLPRAMLRLTDRPATLLLEMADAP